MDPSTVAEAASAAGVAPEQWANVAGLLGDPELEDVAVTYVSATIPAVDLELDVFSTIPGCSDASAERYATAPVVENKVVALPYFSAAILVVDPELDIYSTIPGSRVTSRGWSVTRRWRSSTVASP